MTFNSSNTEMLESATNESLDTIVRTAMSEGCIRPSHVYDAVDEALDRIKKNEALLRRVHDYLSELIRDNLVEDTPRASDLADDVWNAVAIGTKTWKTPKGIK